MDDEAKLAKDLFGEVSSDKIYKVVIDTFERPGEWTAHMSIDEGYARARAIIGTPKALIKGGTLEDKPSEDGDTITTVNPPKYWQADGSYESNYQDVADQHKYVLGVKVRFQKRDYNTFSVTPANPIRLNGIVKAFEIWACGRNKNHDLFVVVQDIKGLKRFIKLGRLNFLGWKRLYARVPDGVVQSDPLFGTRRGLTVLGLYVKCSPLEAWGKYYVYFDNLSAEVSRFFEEYRNNLVSGEEKQDQLSRGGDIPDRW